MGSFRRYKQYEGHCQVNAHFGKEKMPRVEFFHWAECPSHERALAILLETMAEEHIQASVEITEVKSEVEAERYQFYGSPTLIRWHVMAIE